MAIFFRAWLLMLCFDCTYGDSQYAKKCPKHLYYCRYFGQLVFAKLLHPRQQRLHCLIDACTTAEQLDERAADDAAA